MAETAETPRGGAAKYVFAALAVAVLAVGAWVVFVLAADEGPRIEFRTLAVQVGDPERVVVTFEVTKDPALRAECQVTATGDNRDIVNRLTGIRIPAGTQRTTTHTVTVRTDQRATDATVTYCAITGGP